MYKNVKINKGGCKRRGAVHHIRHVVAVVSGCFPTRCFTAVIFPEYFILVPLSYRNDQEYHVVSYLHCSEATVKGEDFY